MNLKASNILVSIGYDDSGNKFARVQPTEGRSFRIQTLGVLPRTHRHGKGDITGSDLTDVREEIKAYVVVHGTDYQKKALGFDDLTKGKPLSPMAKEKLDAYDKLIATFKRGWHVDPIETDTVVFFKQKGEQSHHYLQAKNPTEAAALAVQLNSYGATPGTI